MVSTALFIVPAGHQASSSIQRTSHSFGTQGWLPLSGIRRISSARRLRASETPFLALIERLCGKPSHRFESAKHQNVSTEIEPRVGMATSSCVASKCGFGCRSISRSLAGALAGEALPAQHSLYFFPEPHGHSALRPILRAMDIRFVLLFEKPVEECYFQCGAHPALASRPTDGDNTKGAERPRISKGESLAHVLEMPAL